MVILHITKPLTFCFLKIFPYKKLVIIQYKLTPKGNRFFKSISGDAISASHSCLNPEDSHVYRKIQISRRPCDSAGVEPFKHVSISINIPSLPFQDACNFSEHIFQIL